MTREVAQEILDLQALLEHLQGDAYWMALYRIKNLAVEEAKQTLTE